MPITLTNFLNSGELSELKLGVGKEQVTNFLGQSVFHRTSSPRNHRSVVGICEYSQLQIGFYNNEVIGFGIYYRDPDINRLPPQITIDGYLPNFETDLAEFYNYTNQENLSCLVDKGLSTDDWIVLHVGLAEVSVYFTENKIDSLYISHAPMRSNQTEKFEMY